VTSKSYTVVLEGVDALDLSMGVLRDLCDFLIEGAQRSARLMAEGRSVARGAAPAWVVLAADVHLSRFASGSLDLGIRAPRLVDIAPWIFAQQPPFPAGTDADATAVDLFVDAADDAARGRRDSERLDAGVLDVLARSESLFSRGATRLSLSRTGKSPVVLDSSSAVTIGTLVDETPDARISRVSGVLDALTASTRAIGLRLEDGRLLRGFAGQIPLEQLKDLLGTSVVLEGQFAFRPSGEVLRIQVESAEPARRGDSIWAKLPRVEPSVLGARPLLVPPTDLDAFFGQWPGDEDDEQLDTALRELS
jgi:hypothetical protein